MFFPAARSQKQGLIFLTSFGKGKISGTTPRIVSFLEREWIVVEEHPGFRAKADRQARKRGEGHFLDHL
ncbi:hypothetical protein SDC9_150304 [bioreactor metagenome]|uniref:Uncharacterized protein n=1 Tax=bioreactor metagenome TaxID=1076179 RepID=A0A645EM39_9ZZZZ